MSDAAEWDQLRPRLLDIAGQLDIAISDMQADALLAYLALLQRWNAVYNLTAIREPQQMLVQHVADCLAVLPPLRRQRANRADYRALDVGSGGGLPGVVIALFEPTMAVVCVDAASKKAAFVQHVAATLKLRNLQTVHGRVERLGLPRFDMVTSRAFASLSDFVRLTWHEVSPTGVWMAMKGQIPVEEMADLPPGVEVFHVEQPTVPFLDAKRSLIWLRADGQLNLGVPGTT